MALQKTTKQPRDSRRSLQRLPHLASALLQVSIPAEVKQLRQQESWLRGTGRSSNPGQIPRPEDCAHFNES
jgi:hypothetical protein